MNSKIVTLVMGVFIATLFMSMSSDSEARHENPVYPVVDNCDQIITRTGDVISAKILEIGTTEIKYKKCDNIDGPTIVVARKDVLSIKYANGTTEKIAASTAAPNANSGSADTSGAKTDGLAIAALVTGILAMVLSFGWAGILGLLALIFGAVSLNKIKANPEKFKGKGMATWGLVLGIIAVFVVLLVILL